MDRRWTIALIGIIFIAVMLVFFIIPLMTSIGGSPYYKNIDRCPVETRGIINKYAIDKSQIHECLLQTLAVGERQVLLAMVQFGKANDCPAGCFYSFYCAVIEQGREYPYKYRFYNKQEDFSENVKLSEGVPATAEELAEIKQQIKNNEKFRWCNS